MRVKAGTLARFHWFLLGGLMLAVLLLVVACQPCPPATPTPVPTCPPCETATATPLPPTATPTPLPDKPVCWDSRLDAVGVSWLPRDGQYELVAAWVTIFGNWSDPAIPACAKPYQQDTLGGDHNAYGRAETAGGSPIMETFVLGWQDGADSRTPEADGWANIPIFGGDGRYEWFPFGGDKLVGLTLPGNEHWSFFGVWRPKVSLAAVDEALYEALR